MNSKFVFTGAMAACAALALVIATASIASAGSRGGGAHSGHRGGMNHSVGAMSKGFRSMSGDRLSVGPRHTIGKFGYRSPPARPHNPPGGHFGVVVGRTIKTHGFVNREEYFARRAIGKAIAEHGVVKPHYRRPPTRDPYARHIGRVIKKHGLVNADDYFARRAIGEALAKHRVLKGRQYHRPPKRPFEARVGRVIRKHGVVQ